MKIQNQFSGRVILFNPGMFHPTDEMCRKLAIEIEMYLYARITGGMMHMKIGYAKCGKNVFM